MSMSMDRTFKKSNTGLSLRGRVAAVGLENGRYDIFFAWGGSTICHPPVPLIEDDYAA
jgi:hypothetical protein